MIRHTVVFGLALCLNPSWLCAQSTEFSVNSASTNIYTSPSTGGPVIGTAPRGTVLEVTRELGSWVKISWPSAVDGVAYVHVSTITRSVGPDQNRAAGFTSLRPAPDAAPPTTTVVRVGPTGSSAPPAASTRTVYVAPPAHIVGLGGRIGGPTLGVGASARAWSRKRLGIQFEASRYGLTTAGVPGHVTSMQLAPSLLYSVADRVTDFVWIRPYLGAGAGLHRQTLAVPGATVSVSDSSLGVQAFGGSEFTFPSVPRFALSADVGYRWLRTPFPGFELGGPSVSISGHWYTR
jgi:hypothetical protein